jgi:hypothetical protein
MLAGSMTTSATARSIPARNATMTMSLRRIESLCISEHTLRGRLSGNLSGTRDKTKSTADGDAFSLSL